MIKHFFLSLALIIIITSCKDKSKTEQTKDETLKDLKKDTVVAVLDETDKDYKGQIVRENPKYDNYARFIACMPIKDSKFLKLTSDSTWKKFSSTADTIWKQLETSRFSKMRKFASEEFSEFVNVEKNVLYPFSGPDFVNAYTFFPKGRTFTLIALEPVGDFVDFTTKDPKFVSQYLNDVNLALNDLYKKSYFITSHMGGHLQKHRANGTLPLITLFMVRTGNKILNVQKLNLDSTGNYTLDSLESKNGGRVKAVKIDFTSANDPKTVKSLFYFQADMTDGGLNKTKGLIPFLKSFDNCIGYYKSASYCCFDIVFSKIKNTMLEKCDFIVQDDTGIPFKTFNNKSWIKTFFGVYEKPVRDFESYTHQKDLELAYKDSTNTIRPLPFSLGYHWNTKNQNLMLFKKVK